MRVFIEPKLSNRKLILPIVGEVEIIDGTIDVSEENFLKLKEVSCGFVFSSNKEVEVKKDKAPSKDKDEIKKLEDSEKLNKDSGEDLGSPMPSEPINNSETSEVVDKSDSNNESVDLSFLDGLKVAELREIAKDAGVPNEEWEGLKKGELVDLLKSKMSQ